MHEGEAVIIVSKGSSDEAEQKRRSGNGHGPAAELGNRPPTDDGGPTR